MKMYYIIYILIIAILLTIRFYAFKEKMYKKQNLPYMLLLLGLSIYTIWQIGEKGTIVLPIILAGYLIASWEDLDSMKVYDLYHMIPGLLAVIYLFTQKGLPNDFIGYIPLLFSILTFFSRGMADTIMMCIISIYGMIINQPVNILMCFTFGYLIQLTIILIVCKIKHIKYKDKKFHLPFIPALYSGFMIGMLIL